MPNLDIARAVIKRVNAKFRDGCGNQSTGVFDLGMKSRAAKLSGSQRKALKEDVEHKQIFGIKVTDENNNTVEVVHTLIPTRSHYSGEWLDKEATATVGNCGERSFLAAYWLRQDDVRNVTVLNGAPGSSINHDFVVIGATNIAPRAEYSDRIAPTWQGQDIVICDPWFQAGSGGITDYECGIAYRLAEWPTWMPRIVAATLKGRPEEKQLDRNKFILTVNG